MMFQKSLTVECMIASDDFYAIHVIAKSIKKLYKKHQKTSKVVKIPKKVAKLEPIR